MKSLQNKLNLIKEGKGNKELFLKEARAMFPNVVTGALTFDQAVHNLTERGILSEGFIGVSSKKPNNPDWFQIFNENVKAELKDTDKDVEKLETAGYDYKDEKNSNNLSMESILSGYYAEMKDPKNAEKTEEELKEMVVKNLTKDPLHYMKDGAFGVKGIGYTDEAPGLKASDTDKMMPVKLNEAKHSDEADLKIYKSELNLINKAKAKGKKHEKRKAELEKKIADLESKMNEGMYGDSDGDYEHDLEMEVKANEYYDRGMEAYSEGDFLKADRYYKAALKAGAWLGWDESDLPPYGDKHLEEKSEINEDWGGSDQYAMNQSIHRDLGEPTEFPGLTKILDAAESAVDFYWDDWEEYATDREGLVMKAAKLYANKMFPEVMAGMKKMFAPMEEAVNKKTTEALNEAKNKAMEKAVKEIEKKSELAKAEAKVNQIDELISELESKLSMTEAEGVSDMVDKKKVKEIQRNIKFLEAKKKRYDKEKSRLEGKYGEKKKEIMDEVEEPKKMSYGEAVKEMLKAKGLKK